MRNLQINRYRFFLYLILLFEGNFAFCMKIQKGIFENKGFRDQLLEYREEKGKLLEKGLDQKYRIIKLKKLLDELSLAETLIGISMPQRILFANYDFYPKE